MLVDVDGLDPKLGVEAPEQPHHRGGVAARRVLFLIEEGEAHRLSQLPDDVLRLRGGREGLLASYVELRVMAIDRHVRKNAQRNRSGNDRGLRHPSLHSRERHPQPRAEREQR